MIYHAELNVLVVLSTWEGSIKKAAILSEMHFRSLRTKMLLKAREFEYCLISYLPIIEGKGQGTMQLVLHMRPTELCLLKNVTQFIPPLGARCLKSFSQCSCSLLPYRTKFRRTKFSADKIFGTKSKFRQFCPTKFFIGFLFPHTIHKKNMF